MNKHRIFTAIAVAAFCAVIIILSLSSSGPAPVAESKPATAKISASNSSGGEPAKPGTPAAEKNSAKAPDNGKAEKADSPVPQTAETKTETTEPDASSLVSVTGVSIADRQVLRQNKPIVVSFSAPMVEKSALNAEVAAGDMPFSLEPPVAGQGRWLTVDTFAFMAGKSGYARGKEYRLKIKDKLSSLDGKPVRFLFSFRTEATGVRRADLGSLDKARLEQRLFFTFTLPVSPEALREHLAVTDVDSGKELEYLLHEDAGESANHQVTIKLGNERKQLRIAIRADRDGDRHPLGFDRDYVNNLALKGEGTGVPRLTGAKDQPSDIAVYSNNCWEEGDGTLRARFYLRRPLAPYVQKGLIKVSPDLPYALNSYNDTLIFSKGLEPGMTVTVTLMPGLVDAAGKKLAEERAGSLTVPDRQPAVRFADNGNFLTPVYGGRLALTLVNADQVSVQVYRQYENNLSLMSRSPDAFVKDMMRDVFSKSITVKDGEKNKVMRRALDLDEITRGKKGVYRVQLSAYKEQKYEGEQSYMSWQSSNERLVILSDIGVTGRVFPSGVTVFASSLGTAEPLADAVVSVYSRSNQLIAKGMTGPDGVYMHQRAQKWDDQLRPGVIVVQSGQGDDADITFLPMDWNTTIALQDKGERAYLDKGCEAVLYTPRGVFRPGEKVDVKAFVRDAGQQAPAPFPVLFTVSSPRGTEVARASVTLSDEGGADLSFTLPGTASTGRYHVSLEIPGQQGSQLGYTSFSVEDFVPPRLEASLAPKGKILVGGGSMPVNLSGQYLFGAPGAGLHYELGYRASVASFLPKGFEGYVFGDGESAFTTESNMSYLGGNLDENGLRQVDFSAPSEWDASLLLRLSLIASIQEDSGRWVSKAGQLDVFPKPYLLGLRLEGERLAPGAEAVFQVAAVNPQGEIVESGRLEAEISMVQGNWHSVYRDGRYVYNWNERLIPLMEQGVATEGGKGFFSFTPAQSGRYLVRVATADGKIVASRRFAAWGKGGQAGDEGSGRMDLVELSLDKKEYRPGETARLSVKAPYAGTLFLGIERGSQMSTKVLRMEKAAMVVELPVTKDMNPNASITAWVMRPVKGENREWFSHRAYGVTPLLLSREEHTLRVSAQAPARAAPDKPLHIPFTVTDHHGVPVEGEFSVALVDEGILSLTLFATPDPTGFFMAQRYMVGQTYDAYDALLRPEARATPLLATGGGALAAAYQGSLSTEQIFLAEYLPTIRTDANGQGEASFNIPEYSGKGRLMIVGASQDRFASSATQIRFARDLVMEASAPRAVAPGDEFDLSLKLFTLTSEDGDSPLGEARVTVSAQGPATLSGDLEKTLSLTPEEGKTTVSHPLHVRATAGQASGIVRYTARVEVPGRDDLGYSKTFETVVRPPFPRTSFARSVLIPAGQRETLDIPGEWLEGTARLSFSIDRSPVMAILPALQFLREYPYGCLEQTVSRAWPYLTLAEIQRALYPDKDESANADVVLNDVVNRVTAMMTSDGGFGLWPGYGRADPWRSINAAFFLQEARSRVKVAPAVFDRVLGYLRFTLAAPIEHYSNKQYGYSTKAYAAFVLTRAGEAPLGWLQTLSANENDMYPSGRIFLAGAKALQAGNSNALKALDEKALDLSGSIAFNESLESNLRNKSLLLYVWSLVDPASARTAQLSAAVAETLGRQRWYNPQDSGMAALALGTYLEKTGTANQGFTAVISSNGKELAKVEDGKRLLLGHGRLETEKGKAPEINVSVGEQGNAYCVYSLRGVPMAAPPPASSELAVQRVWKDASGAAVDLSSGQVRLKKGDRITVELTVKAARNVSDVVLSDLTPGGMEVENPRLSASTAGADGQESEYGHYVDQREDRLLVFFDRLYGKTTYTYTMRAVSSGTFVLPPLAADCMYEPEVNAITASGTLVVE